jgi:ATPase subunit of ABC transporter with duplicated ATPase domains
MTVALDEPDNYLALPEIEPFLHELEDAAERNLGQVFLISHHPEIYNQWANDPERCRFLARTSDGRFVAREVNWDQHSGLLPAEVVARGWEDA